MDLEPDPVFVPSIPAKRKGTEESGLTERQVDLEMAQWREHRHLPRTLPGRANPSGEHRRAGTSSQDRENVMRVVTYVLNCPRAWLSST
jgi:hypothetical protein